MKITMYELLGMVKDGKAPKKIKVYGIVYINNGCNCYLDENDKSLCDNLEIPMFLNDEIVILDNLEEEKKIPEKSSIDFNTKLPVSGCSENEAFMMTCISHLGKTIDSLIDYLKSKGDE